MLRNPTIGALTFIFLLIAVNLVWLDIIIVSNSSNVQPVTTDVVATCDLNCRDAISADIISRLTTPSPVVVQRTVATSQPAKEYYIPLGSGSTRSNEYVALEGAEAYIDTSLYGTIKSVTFEVFLRNPTGNGRTYAKLFNVTDKHDVWFSEVNFEGGGLVKKEATITLEPGNKLYRVYLKSTLAYDVYADNARIHIVTQ
ncbi:hypothetical protein HY410_00900 [Candidatus Gottesmanbacteria bacterium]|nr:hypothetical protein [Candidatus Gottesmanbacteria bacterium]